MSDKRIEFLEDFKKLLGKHDVELEVCNEDEWNPYVETYFQWKPEDWENEYSKEDINFGRCIDIEKIESLIETIIKEEKKEV